MSPRQTAFKRKKFNAQHFHSRRKSLCDSPTQRRSLTLLACSDRDSSAIQNAYTDTVVEAQEFTSAATDNLLAMFREVPKRKAMMTTSNASAMHRHFRLTIENGSANHQRKFVSSDYGEANQSKGESIEN